MIRLAATLRAAWQHTTDRGRRALDNAHPGWWSNATDTCACDGLPVVYGYDGDPTRHRGMCAECDEVRCDAFPLDCPRRAQQWQDYADEMRKGEA